MRNTIKHSSVYIGVVAFFIAETALAVVACGDAGGGEPPTWTLALDLDEKTTAEYETKPENGYGKLVFKGNKVTRRDGYWNCRGRGSVNLDELEDDGRTLKGYVYCGNTKYSISLTIVGQDEKNVYFEGEWTGGGKKHTVKGRIPKC